MKTLTLALIHLGWVAVAIYGHQFDSPVLMGWGLIGASFSTLATMTIIFELNKEKGTDVQ